ncbi:MAG: hypothetical protein JXR64_06385, partial [Spirochaetales bacterium]|nr:hypothetical protein [Spirochaetales bacterium]
VCFEKFVSGLSYGDSILTHGYYLDKPELLGYVPLNDKTCKILEEFGFKWSNVTSSVIAKMELLKV